jgi:hypothetical protein
VKPVNVVQQILLNLDTKGGKGKVETMQRAIVAAQEQGVINNSEANQCSRLFDLSLRWE